MAKDKLTDYSATNASNTDVGGVNIDEGMLPSAVNNSIRELMTHLKNFSDGTDAIDALDVTGDLTVDTNTLHVDAANNRVGVGTTTPADHLAVVTSGANAQLSVDRSDGATGRTVLIHSTSGGQLQTTGSVPLIFGTADTERGRFLSGGGLTFNGDTAAANALDDYEEGQWTPTISTGTIGSSYAYYTKVGNLVTLNLNVHTISDRTDTGTLLIGGLPYTSSSNNRAIGAVMHRYIDDSGEDVTAWVDSNASSLKFYLSQQSTNWQQLRHVDLMSASAQFYMTITYQAA